MRTMACFFRKFLLLALVIPLILSACMPAASAAEPVPTFTRQVLPSKTPTPVSSPSPRPSPTGTATQTPIPIGEILIYQSQVLNHSQIFLMDLDYGTRLQLTSGTVDSSVPNWSPDGWHIVYQVNKMRSSKIHRMDWDGKNNKMLSRDGEVADYLPVVSPDGTQIAYFSPQPGHWALFLMDMNGKHARPITDNTVFESAASWSPDGRQIVFTPWRNTENPPLIGVAGVDGKEHQELTEYGTYARDPSWSPDGSQVIYTCTGSGSKQPQICSMNPDGSGKKFLTTGPGGSDTAVWSPDGKKIAFVSWRDSAKPESCDNGDCNFEIYVMNADGSGQQRLTDHPNEDWFPSWSPDSTRLAFVSLRDEPRHPGECGETCNSEIYMMNADGSGVQRLTTNNIPDWNPLWRPPVKGIAAPSTPTETPPAPVFVGGGQNKLSFWASDEKGSNIYTISLDGTVSEGTVLNQGEGHSWSPDGKKLSFVIRSGMGNSRIDILDPKMNLSRTLVQSDSSLYEPAWSPDGKKIAYSVDHAEIYTINPDGSGAQQIIHGNNEYYEPAWSPDSQQLLFLGSAGGLGSSLYIANSDGTNFHQIAADADWSSPASWSPDGQWIAYGCQQGAQTQICRMRPDGSEKTMLTSQSTNSGPVWSPDGQWIAFCSYRDRNWEIYIMRANGSEHRRITEDWLDNFGPAWIP